jgi:hypothetical protein
MYAYFPNRVLRQFGHIQSIYSSHCDVICHSTTIEDMYVMFMQHAVDLIDLGPLVNDPLDYVDGYMKWFRRISHPYIISRGQNPVVPGSSIYTTLVIV